MTTRFTLAAGALVLVLGTLAACTGAPSSSTAGAGPVSPTTTSATPTQAAADGSAGHPLAFGQTWQPPGKMKISIGAPSDYKPSSSAFALSGKTPRAVVVDVSVTNTPDAPAAVPAMVITVQATAGDQQAQEIEDSANGVGSPTASIAPGKTLTWRVAFGLPAAKGEFTVQVGALGGGQNVYFTGTA
jgi:hypothetical protein